MQFTTLLFSGLCRFVNRIARDHIDEISRTMSLWHCLNDFLVFLDAHACTQKTIIMHHTHFLPMIVLDQCVICVVFCSQ